MALAAGLVLSSSALVEAQAYRLIQRFDFTPLDGASPAAPLIQGSDGALYGVTSGPIGSNLSTAFRIARDGSSFEVLHAFGGLDGDVARGSLVEGADGALYGTTAGGGALGHGVVFRLATDGSSFAVLHSFDGVSGGGPISGVMQGSDGALYGTTTEGNGTVFRVTSDGSSFQVLHDFDAAQGSPRYGLVQGPGDVLYGTTVGNQGGGAAFALGADGSGFAILHAFDPDFSEPAGRLLWGLDGDLYGISLSLIARPSLTGTVFKISRHGYGSGTVRMFDYQPFWASFSWRGGEANLVQDEDGALYGTAFVVGKSASTNAIFRMGTDGGWFSWVRDLGSACPAGLVRGRDGVLYGTLLPDATTPGAIFRFDDEEGIQFARPSFVRAEGDRTVVVSVVRTGKIDEAASVYYDTTGGTAVPDIDYEPASGSLTFPRGVARAKFTMNIHVNLSPWEHERSILLGLFGAQGAGARLGFQKTAVVMVSDRGTAAQLQFSASTYKGLEDSYAAVTVVRSGSLEGAVAVDYATLDDSALSPADYVATVGTLSFSDGEAIKNFVVPLAPDAVFDPGEVLSLVLSNPGGGAILGPRSVAKLTIQEPRQALEFQSSDYSARESAGAALITVRRRGPPAGWVMVDYATAGGTAIPGVDYVPTSGTLTFGPGVTARAFRVPITSDALAEGSETVTLTLSNVAEPALPGGCLTAVLTILDDDGVVQFSAAKYAVQEPAGGRHGQAVLRVTRRGGLSSPAHVLYATRAGSAVPGLEYGEASGELTFGPGVALASIPIALYGNSTGGTNPTVMVTLTQVDAPLGSPATATLTIRNDDVAGTVQVAEGVLSTSVSVAMATVTVTRKGGAAGPVSVHYATSDGLAVAGVDYVPVDGTLTFGAKETSKSILVPLLPGCSPSRDFVVTLDAPAGGLSLGSPSSARVWIAGG